MTVRVDCSPPMPGMEKVLDEAVRTREGHVQANTVPALQRLQPPRGFSSKALLRAESPGSKPQQSQPQACPDTEPAEPFGKKSMPQPVSSWALLSRAPPYPSNITHLPLSAGSEEQAAFRCQDPASAGSSLRACNFHAGLPWAHILGQTPIPSGHS